MNAADDFDPFDIPAEPVPVGSIEDAASPRTTLEFPQFDLPPNARVARTTEIERFFDCGFRHGMYLGRMWKEAAGAARARGSGVHKAREIAYKHFLAKGELPALEELESVAIAEVRKRMEGEPDDEIGGAVEDAVTFVRGDHALLLPMLAPHVIAVEPRIVVPLAGEGIEPDSWFLSGTPDSIARDPTTNAIVVPDLKTGARATTQQALNASMQLTGYAFLVREATGSIPVLAHHSLRILKNAPKAKEGLTWKPIRTPSGDQVAAVAERKATVRSEEDLLAFVRRVNVFVACQQEGVALPASTGAILSSCLNCAHRGHREPSQRCPFVPSFRGGEEVGFDVD